MKLTVVLLLSIAVTSIIGTVIPQNENPAAYFREYGEFFYQLFSMLGIFDMYHSWWFQLLILCLTLNIVVCSIERLSTTWKIVFVNNPPFNISRFRKLSQKESFNSGHKLEDLRNTYEPFIARRFRYSRVERTDQGFCIFAEKGRWTRLGVYAIHLSVVILLIGGLIGSVFGFAGYVNIPEGEKVDTVRLRNVDTIEKLDFEISCEDFDVSFYPNGAPKEYRSSLTILEGGKPVYKKDIVVNDPLRYKGINIFQSSYGQMPSDAARKRKVQGKDTQNEILLNFTSKKTGTAYQVKTVVGKPIDIPEQIGQFVIVAYKKSALFGGQDIGEAYVGKLTPKDGNTVDILLPLHFPQFDKMRKGAVVISVAGQETETFRPDKKPDIWYYTGLQVTKDPGVWVVYTGFIVIIIGCYITFFMSHQRLCVDVNKSGKNSKVIVTGTANKNKLGMENKIKRIARQLEDLVKEG